MQLIDLSRTIEHRTPAHPSHPPVIVTVWNDHSEVKKAGNTEFTSKSLTLSMSDHSATHVDVPCHFSSSANADSIDKVPLENFYTEAICLDLSQVALKHEITADEMETALDLKMRAAPDRQPKHRSHDRRWFLHPARSVCSSGKLACLRLLT